MSILIPTIIGREICFSQIVEEIEKQLKSSLLTYEIIACIDEKQISIGTKRNLLLSQCQGFYVVFLDDDDAIHPEFFKTYEPMFLSKKYDIGQLTGAYYNKEKFVKAVHFALENTWSETHTTYLRPPQHLTPMTLTLAKLIKYNDIIYGEDKDFGNRLLEYAKKNKLIEFSVSLNNFLYHYLDGIKDTRIEKEWKFTENGNVLNLVPRCEKNISERQREILDLAYQKSKEAVQTPIIFKLTI